MAGIDKQASNRPVVYLRCVERTMPVLSSELEYFVNKWLTKAERCSTASVEDCYDKFFTLFVVFNRLYAEATFELARRGEIKINQNRSLSDKAGATEHTLKMIGVSNFQSLYDTFLITPVDEIAQLIAEERFHILLSKPNGDPQPDKDRQLLAKLRSSGKTQLLAVLEFVYAIRCNLFHGHKGFEPVQVDLLRPTISILATVIKSLHEACR